jgi:mycothiol system anti-sigma-R factor
MPDCNETLRELEQFLDRELSNAAHQEINAHLDGCPDCHQAFDFHAELRQLIARKCHNDEMPAGLMERIARCFGEDYLDTGAETGTETSRTEST